MCTKSRSIRFEEPLDEQNVKNADGSVVETIEAERLLVSDHHITILPLQLCKHE